MRYTSQVLVAATTCLAFASAFKASPEAKRPTKNIPLPSFFNKRQLPEPAIGVQSIVSPSGVNITYKDPGAEGVCETTPGVKSYAGFVNLAPDVHSFVSNSEKVIALTY